LIIGRSIIFSSLVRSLLPLIFQGIIGAIYTNDLVKFAADKILLKSSPFFYIIGIP